MEIDVDVIVPVYNTMPYLRKCLDSLVRQTIGRDRLHVIAVDDGSTDGSGRELDRYAARYPGFFTVLHQANSGGPARPCNRALDIATGRYVFFLGADDRLGPQAMQRQVAAADEWHSDVVLGKVVGVNSRYIEQDIFARTEPAVGLLDSPLARSLANTKLFRRALLETHGIRYPEDMPIGSDLPFTLAACYHAARVSVLADEDHYFAVRRHSATNITYLSRPALRLRTVEKMLAFLDDLIEPGEERDVMLVRHFEHEVAKLLEDDFLRLDRATQELVHSGVQRIAAAYFTDEIAQKIPVETRIRVTVARDGTVDDLLCVIEQDASVGVPPTVERDGRRLAAYASREVDVTTAPDWRAKLDATAIRWVGSTLVITARTPLANPGSIAVNAQGVVAHTTVDGSTVRARLRIRDLLAASDAGGQRRIVLANTTPIRWPRADRPLPRVRLKGARPVLVTPVRDPSGKLMISVIHVTPQGIAARLRRLIRRWPASRPDTARGAG